MFIDESVVLQGHMLDQSLSQFFLTEWELLIMFNFLLNDYFAQN